MKPTRDIQINRSEGSLSIKMPTVAKAYVPKVNMRRPGNVMLLLILLFLILLFGGLAMADVNHGIGLTSSPCNYARFKSLQENEKDHKTTVLGFKLINAEEACTYLEYCDEGYPTNSGCKNDTGVDISAEFYVSDSLFQGRQDIIPNSPLTDVCSIESLTVQNCKIISSSKEKVLFYKVQGMSGFYLGQHSILLGPSFKSLDDFNCTGLPSTQCDGDDVFKNIFSSAGADKSCFCHANPDGQIPYIMISGKLFQVDYLFYQILDVQYKVEKEEDLSCINCEVSCSAGRIIIEYDQPLEILELCSGSFCMSLTPKSIMNVPLSLAAMSNVYTFFIRFEDRKEKHGTLQCRIEDLCPLIDCHLCFEKLRNPHCYNALDKINFLIIIAVWFVLLAIVAKIMKIVIYGSKFVLLFLKFIYQLTRWVVKKTLSLIGIKMILINETISRTVEMEDGTLITESSTSKKTKFYKRPMPTYIKAIALISVSLLPLALGCTETATLDSSQLDCIMESGNLKCTTKSSARIVVAPVGQSSCFIFKTPDGLNSGSIEVETQSLSLLCNKEVHYWTYDADVVLEQKCFCTWSSSGYGSDERCSKYNENTNCGSPLSCSNGGLHKSYCRTAIGGWEQGCFSYGSNYCYFSVHFLNRRKTSYEVSSCSSFYWQANLKVKIQTLEKDEIHEARVSPGTKFSFNGGYINLESVSIPPIPVLNSCFVKSKKGVYITDCQKRGGIVPGKIGELQCPSKSTAENPSKSCSISSQILRSEPVGSRIRVRTSLYFPSSLTRKLPILSSGYMIKEVDGVIRAKVNHISLLGLKLSLNGLTLQPYSIKSKCSVKFIEAKGCVSCLTGSKMELKTKSEEGSIKAVLTCPSLKAAVPFVIQNKEKKTELSVHFENGLIDEECLIKCPGNEVKIRVKASLVSDVQVSRTFDDSFDDFVDVTTNWMKGFFGQFNGLIYYPLIGLLVLGSVGVLWYMFCQGEKGYHYKRF